MYKKLLSLLLCLSMVLAIAVPSVSAATDGAFTVEALQTESLINPIGIDETAPRLSWQMKSSARAQSQSAYRIMVATGLENLTAGNYDMWDTGTVTGSASVDIVYGGTALTARTRYYWQVAVTNQAGTTVTSAPAYFETGLMETNPLKDISWLSKGEAPTEEEDTSITSFTVEADVRTDSVGAIVFGYQDENNYFMWQFKNSNTVTDGTVTATKMELVPHVWKAGSVSVMKWGLSNSAVDVSTGAHLKIVVTDGTIETYIGEKKVWTADASVTGGKFDVGKIGIRQVGGEVAEYDNFKITLPDGTVYFEEDFSDEDACAFAGGTFTEDGWYHYNAYSNVKLATYGVLKNVSFDVEADVQITSKAAGLIFGAEDSSNCYMWQFSSDNGKVLLVGHKFTDGKITYPVWRTLSNDFTELTDATAHLKIEVRGGVISTYINNTKVNTYTAEPFSVKNVGIYESGGESAKFKNFTVTLKSGTVYYSDLTADKNDFGGTAADDMYSFGAQTVLTNIDDGTAAPVTDPNAKYRSFTVEAEMLVLNRAGIFFAGTDKLNYTSYVLGAGSPAEYIGYQYVDGAGINLQWKNTWNDTVLKDTELEGLTGTYIKNNYIKVKVVVEEGKVTSYLNGYKLWTSQTLISPSQIGLVGIVGAASVKSFKATLGDGSIFVSEDFTNADNLMFAGGTLTDGVYTFSTSGLHAAHTDGWEMSEQVAETPAPMFRREFTVKDHLKSARLYITSAGTYEGYVNGVKMTDSYLNPGRDTFNRHLMYQTFDVTDKLTAGDNAIGFILGHGWYNRAGQNTSPYLGIGLKLYLTYADGSEEVIIPDADWQYYYDGPVREDHLWNGETYDAAKEVNGWANAGLADTSKWTAPKLRPVTDFRVGTIIAQKAALSTVYKEVQAVSVTKVEGVSENVYVYDFGQNLAGIVRITSSQPAGTTIKMRHGEKLYTAKLSKNNYDPDDLCVPGALWTKNLDGTDNDKALQTDYYIFKGEGTETFEPSLVYHGFQYMELYGLDEPIPVENVTALALMTDMEQTGDVEVSNELVNKYVSNTRWSQIGNFLSVPTDCPQRNERQGWTGDAQIFARTGAYLMNVNAFMEKYQMDMTDVRQGVIYPEAAPGWSSNRIKAGWSDAGIIIPWQMYQQYGNTRILEENYDNLKAYVEEQLKETNNTYIDQEHTTYGDWLAGEPTPKVITETAFAAYTANLFSKIAAVLGKTEDATVWKNHYEKYREAWAREFVNDDGTMKCDPAVYGTGEWGNATHKTTGEVTSQCAYVLGLQFDLFPETVKPLAAAKLNELVIAGEYHIKTGFLGVSYLLPVLTENGYVDTACRMMEETGSPSWLYSVVNGATTIYEYWWAHSVTDTTESYSGSMNHYSYGSATEWLFKDILGIERDESNPGFKHVILQPNYGGTFTYAKGYYDSKYGRISADWKLSGDDFIYTVEIPANTTATVVLPTGAQVLEGSVAPEQAEGVTRVIRTADSVRVQIGSGSYTFTVKSVGNSGGSTIETEVPSILGANIRLGDNAGIRFAAKVIKGDFFNKYYTSTDSAKTYQYAKADCLQFGTIIIPSSLVENGKTVVEMFQQGNSNVLDIPAVMIYAQDENSLTYTGVITQVPKTAQAYTKTLQTAFYVRYRSSADAEWTYAFSDGVSERSYFECADAALKNDYNSTKLPNPTEAQKKIIQQLNEITQVVESTGWIGGDNWY